MPTVARCAGLAGTACRAMRVHPRLKVPWDHHESAVEGSKRVRFTDLVPADAVLEQVYTGCSFAEGPAADAEGNVYFSDCPNNRIMLYRKDGTTTIWKEPSG